MYELFFGLIILVALLYCIIEVRTETGKFRIHEATREIENQNRKEGNND